METRKNGKSHRDYINYLVPSETALLYDIAGTQMMPSLGNSFQIRGEANL